MAKTLGSLPRLKLTARPTLRYTPRRQIRCFSVAPKYHTDGVYRELTAMRTRTPFIEAFRKQQENKLSKPISVDGIERDLSPKSMSDSYHKVVCHMM